MIDHGISPRVSDPKHNLSDQGCHQKEKRMDITIQNNRIQKKHDIHCPYCYRACISVCNDEESHAHDAYDQEKGILNGMLFCYVWYKP